MKKDYPVVVYLDESTGTKKVDISFTDDISKADLYFVLSAMEMFIKEQKESLLGYKTEYGETYRFEA